MQEKVNPIDNKQEVAQYNELFNQTQLSTDKLTTQCLTDIIDSALEQSTHTAGLAISQQLAELVKTYAGIKHKTTQDLLTLSHFEKLQLNQTRYKLLKQLSEQINVLAKALTTQTFNATCLIKLQSQATKALEYFTSQYANPEQFNKRLVVLDTNCLMHSLPLLDKIKPSDQLIIPITVIEELDRLKEDKKDDQWTDKAKCARAAIERLNKLNNDCYQQPRLRLLEKVGSGKNATPDVKILSVAAYFRLCTSILLTDDKNLRNLATAEGIANQSTQQYLAGSAKKSKKRKGK